ncbi:alpha/beta fold hydrolase [Oceanicola sp. 22II-s10i]|uniref:alpha/beta fold hydrolase n=1 Tax=Oceanicola sp. 22II-s10i TaxID=1317116 RepID=UPI000B523667|nr:alpha/beta hydrolase [Oceanicola sp. 22II-s10i]
MAIEWIETPRGAFRFELTGQGDRPVIVLMHEMGGSLDSWNMVMPRLAVTHRILRYDARGFGNSVKLTGPLTMDDWVADLAALLDALWIRRPCELVGTALAGGAALAFAAAHPERTSAVLATSPVTEVLPERRPAIADLADRMERDGMMPLVGSLDTSYPEILRTDPAAFAAFRARWLANDPRSFAETYRMLSRLDLRDDLRRITRPVQLIGATHDALRPPALVEPLRDLIPGASYREVNSGHFMAVQTPDLFLDIATKWLAEPRQPVSAAPLS